MDRPLTTAALPLALLPLSLVAGCATVSTGWPDPGPDAPPADQGPVGAPAGGSDACSATAGQRVLELVNGIRREHGLGALAAEAALVAAAVAHTEDQAAGGAGAIGHVGSDGSAPGDRVTAAGYRWSMVSENVAAGYRTPDVVVAAWMDSPPHRATILSPDAIHAGVGRAPGTGTAGAVWTLNVAAPLRVRSSVNGVADDLSHARVLRCHP